MGIRSDSGTCGVPRLNTDALGQEGYILHGMSPLLSINQVVDSSLFNLKSVRRLILSTDAFIFFTKPLEPRIYTFKLKHDKVIPQF